MQINDMNRSSGLAAQLFARVEKGEGKDLPIDAASMDRPAAPDGVVLSERAQAMAAAQRRENIQGDMASVFDLAYSRDTLQVNETETPDGTTITRASDGTIVTPGQQRAFNKMAEIVREKRVNIVETEMAKGSSPAKIENMLQSYMDNLPERYRLDINWPTGG